MINNVFNDICDTYIIYKFINHIMKNGKKKLAYKIFINMLKEIDNIILRKNNLYIRKSGITSSLELFKIGIYNVMPHVRIVNKRIGGILYSIPSTIDIRKREYFAIKWIIQAAKKKSGNFMYKKLAIELINAFSGIGDAIKKRNELHRMAESNQAFSHFKF